MITWLYASTVWILLVVAPGGLHSQLAVYATSKECESAKRTLQVVEPLQAMCVEKVR